MKELIREAIEFGAKYNSSVLRNKPFTLDFVLNDFIEANEDKIEDMYKEIFNAGELRGEEVEHREMFGANGGYVNPDFETYYKNLEDEG